MKEASKCASSISVTFAMYLDTWKVFSVFGNPESTEHIRAILLIPYRPTRYVAISCSDMSFEDAGSSIVLNNSQASVILLDDIRYALACFDASVKFFGSFLFFLASISL